MNTFQKQFESTKENKENPIIFPVGNNRQMYVNSSNMSSNKYQEKRNGEVKYQDNVRSYNEGLTRTNLNKRRYRRSGIPSDSKGKVYNYFRR